MPRDDAQAFDELVAEALPGRRLVEPPDGTLRRAIALGGGLRARRGAGGWLVALLFDSAVQPQPAGVRAAPGGQRRLLYEARRPDGTPMQIDLHLRREPRGTLEITGQVLPPVDGAEILARVSRVTRRKALGPQGEFLLHGLPSRAAGLRLELNVPGEAALVFPDVPLLPAGGEPR